MEIHFGDKKLTNKSVLIVEDDATSFELLREVMEQTEAKITHAISGRQALDIFESENFDLVLLDIKIPEIDGLEVARQFKLSKNHIPIIAQSAKALLTDRMKCLEAGCDEYVPKPIPIRELYDKINRLLS